MKIQKDLSLIKRKVCKAQINTSRTEGLLQHSRQYCMAKIRLLDKGVNQGLCNVL